MKNSPYEINITFNNKRYTVSIIMDRTINGKVQCDFEILTDEKMTGNDFQKLKTYLEKEGYVDAALDHYGYPNSSM